mmetsp:Transcript_11929/g.29178  ORF Transcript_11929/g.29178 Transcript_11929/m.29178 type:complete len:244 (+) Transcript_11929:385-1116(+)
MHSKAQMLVLYRQNVAPLLAAVLLSHPHRDLACATRTARCDHLADVRRLHGVVREQRPSREPLHAANPTSSLVLAVLAQRGGGVAHLRHCVRDPVGAHHSVRVFPVVVLHARRVSRRIGHRVGLGDARHVVVRRLLRRGRGGERRRRTVRRVRAAARERHRRDQHHLRCGDVDCVLTHRRHATDQVPAHAPRQGRFRRTHGAEPAAGEGGVLLGRPVRACAQGAPPLLAPAQARSCARGAGRC